MASNLNSTKGVRPSRNVLNKVNQRAQQSEEVRRGLAQDLSSNASGINRAGAVLNNKNEEK